MGPILILLVFLGGTMMLIVGGTRVSLYLFTRNALGTNHVVAEKPLPIQERVVERPVLLSSRGGRKHECPVRAW